MDLLLFMIIVCQCSASIPPRGARKEVNRALNIGVRSLNFDSDEDDNDNEYGSTHSSARTRLRGPFSDDEDEGNEVSSSGISSGTSARSSAFQRLNHLKLNDIESDLESSVDRGHTSVTSGLGSDSPSIDQSDSDRSRYFLDQSVEREEGGTLVGLESPIGPKLAGGTPTLGLVSGRPKLYTRHGWRMPEHQRDDVFSSRTPESPSYGSASFDEFLSPPRHGPLASNHVASLNELYHSPRGGFHLDKHLWSHEDRRYIKAAKPPPAPGSLPAGAMVVRGRQVPSEFLQAVKYGREHNNKALSSMKWKKTFISGNSATVYGIELNGDNYVLKITKHSQFGASHNDETPQCVHENDIRSLHQSNDPCAHRPKDGLIRKVACSADHHLVPFEYYIAEKVALARGLIPAAASVADTFGKDQNEWYLIFEELPGISPLKYGENILERLAKPLIRKQLEALQQIASCHIMHLDAHWGNILYSRERGVQLIDFGIATLVDRFELPDYKATLIITFTLDRCLDCEASKIGRDFRELVTNAYPIDGHTILSHPWLQY